MRRIVGGIVLGLGLGAVACALAGGRAGEAPGCADGERGVGAGEPAREEQSAEEVGGGGGRDLGARCEPPSATRLAARGRCGPASGTTAGGEDAGPLPRTSWTLVLEGHDGSGSSDALRRQAAPWEPPAAPSASRAEGGPFERGGPDVLERVYDVAGALVRMANDPPEVRVAWTTGEAAVGAQLEHLGARLYDRTGEAAWRTPGAGIGVDPEVNVNPGLHVRQTADVLAKIEAALDEILPLGGDARTVRVWRGRTVLGTLAVGEARRLDAEPRILDATSSPAVRGAVELDVPVERVVTGFLGDAHVLVADYDVEISQAAQIRGPLLDLGHDGLSVRARRVASSDELEVELREGRATLPLATFSTSLAGGSAGGADTVVIELPRTGPRVLLRIPAREGETWLVGLGEDRAAVVEVGASVTGAGAIRRGWMRLPPSRDDAADEPATELVPPRGAVAVHLLRPSRREGEPAWSTGVVPLRPHAVALHGFDRTREEALPAGAEPYGAGSADELEDRVAVLRGGTCVSGRWVGGTPHGEAYDLVLSVAETAGTRPSPPLLGGPEGSPSRRTALLPSFRRAVVPLRIVVPHGGVGRRTVTLDLGNGPQPWTVSLSGGVRAE